MAHESFENPQIAQLMNEHYVNIKVDREERPDLDQIYQVVAQMITRGGGWPLTVFLTPDLKPFYGGTYFPPTDRYGRPGFAKILYALSKAYQQDRAEILDRAEKMTGVIRNHESAEEWTRSADPAPVEVPGTLEANPFDSEKNRRILLASAKSLLTYIDYQNGGIGTAPKFPQSMVLSFLFRMSQMNFVLETDRESMRSAVLLSLEKMARGGIFDQLGGGFHRYSVDDHWAVPHFEKMLYDNALLLRLYSEVVLKGDLSPAHESLFIETIRKTVQYVDREMVSPEGLFFAAQDADSRPHENAPAEEGAFFVWTREQLAPILTPDELSLFCEFYGVTEQGNFENGETVLFQAQEKTALTEAQRTKLAQAEEKVFLAREKRIRPGLDDKALISWNALMISGLVWSALALTKKKALEFELESGLESRLESTVGLRSRKLALGAREAIQKFGFASQSRLFSTIQKENGQPKGKGNGYLDDYAFLAQAELELTRVDPRHAEKYFASANTLINQVIQYFKKSGEAGFYFTANDHEVLIHRPSSFFDQAIPSGVGVTLGVLAVLEMASLVQKSTQEATAQEATRTVLDENWRGLEDQLEKNAFGASELLCSLLLREFSPVMMKGKIAQEWRENPFAWVESNEGPAQFCHRQVCRETWPLEKG